MATGGEAEIENAEDSSVQLDDEQSELSDKEVRLVFRRLLSMFSPEGILNAMSSTATRNVDDWTYDAANKVTSDCQQLLNGGQYEENKCPARYKWMELGGCCDYDLGQDNITKMIATGHRYDHIDTAIRFYVKNHSNATKLADGEKVLSASGKTFGEAYFEYLVALRRQGIQTPNDDPKLVAEDLNDVN